MERMNIQMFAEETPPAQQPQVTPPEQNGGIKSSEVLRELSKHLGINLFDKEGIETFKSSYGELKSGLSAKDEAIRTLENEKTSFAQKEADYQLKIEALGLGFKAETLEEVLALAKVNAKDGDVKEGLKKVKEKFGSFMTSQAFGTQHNDGTPPPMKTEQERYLENNRLYQAYKNKK